MRQVFNALPWLPPAEHPKVCELFEKFGRHQTIAKSTILKGGGDENRLFFITKGLCLYFVNYSQGKTSIMALLLPHRSICNLSCISGDKVNVTTYAKSGTELLSISPEQYRRFIRENSDIAEIAMKAIIAKQESQLEGLIANSTLEPEDRLKTFYKALYSSYNLLGQKTLLEAPLKLTNEELGMIISASRVTVNRIQNKWIQSGLAEKLGGRIYLHAALFNDIADWHDHLE